MAVSAFALSSDVVAFDSGSPHAPAGPLVNAAASPDQSERGALQKELWRGADTAPTRLQRPPYSAPLLDLASAPVTTGDCHRRPEGPVVIADHRTKFPAIHHYHNFLQKRSDVRPIFLSDHLLICASVGPRSRTSDVCVRGAFLYCLGI